MPSTTIRYSTLPENSYSNSILSAYQENLAASVPPSEPDAVSPAPTRGGSAASSEPDPAHLPDSDPRSPRYEPPHLRHRPGDTFEIGGKPHDPLDPGVYGTPNWRPDPRTGRHRHGELPDPHPDFDLSRPPGFRADPSGDHPDRPQRRPLPGPADPEPSLPDASRAPTRPLERHPRHRRWEMSDTEPPPRFSPMREAAMRRFLELSQPFRDAHFEPEPPGLAQRARWVLSWLLWTLAFGLVATPRPLTAHRVARATGGEPRSAPWTGMGATPHQERPPASDSVPYMDAWEQHFDSRHSLTFGGAA